MIGHSSQYSSPHRSSDGQLALAPPRALRHLFIQLLFANKCIPISKLESFLSKVKSQFSPSSGVHPHNLESILQSINESFAKLEMRVVIARSEINGERSWSLIDLCTQTERLFFCQSLTNSETLFVRFVIEQCLRKRSGIVNQDYVLKQLSESSELKALKFSETSAIVLLDKLSNSGYLMHVGQSSITLSCACVAELQPFISKLESAGVFMRKCAICRQICILGFCCVSKICAAKVHLHCYESFCAKRDSMGLDNCVNQECQILWGENFREWSHLIKNRRLGDENVH